MKYKYVYILVFFFCVACPPYELEFDTSIKTISTSDLEITIIKGNEIPLPSIYCAKGRCFVFKITLELKNNGKENKTVELSSIKLKGETINFFLYQLDSLNIENIDKISYKINMEPESVKRLNLEFLLNSNIGLESIETSKIRYSSASINTFKYNENNIKKLYSDTLTLFLRLDTELVNFELFLNENNGFR